MPLLPRNDSLGWTPYAWLIYLIFFLLNPIVKRAGTWEWVATGAATVVFLVLYFRGYWPGKTMTSIVGITLLAIVFYPYNAGAGSLFIYAAAFAGWLPDRRRAVWSIGIIEAIAIGETLVFEIHPLGAIWPIVFVLIIGATNMHGRQREQANARLRLAQEEIEQLAKTAERERIARDLHDLLGHTLSLIVLKSELASKLAERDVERARSEINDVERISREALAQVRSAIGGYRSRGLSSEIENARQALTAAGMKLDVSTVEHRLTPVREAVLALALREAVTNVVRHSGATRCSIDLRHDESGLRLAIADDGTGGAAPFGNGLTGMRERVESIGGTLERSAAAGTRIVITLPAEAQAARERSA